MTVIKTVKGVNTQQITAYRALKAGYSRTWTTNVSNNALLISQYLLQLLQSSHTTLVSHVNLHAKLVPAVLISALVAQTH